MNITEFTFGDTVEMTNKAGETKTGFVLSYGCQKTIIGELIPGTQNACLVKGTLMDAAERDKQDKLWDEVHDGVTVKSAKEVLFEKGKPDSKNKTDGKKTKGKKKAA